MRCTRDYPKSTFFLTDIINNTDSTRERSVFEKRKSHVSSGIFVSVNRRPALNVPVIHSRLSRMSRPHYNSRPQNSTDAKPKHVEPSRIHAKGAHGQAHHLKQTVKKEEPRYVGQHRLSNTSSEGTIGIVEDDEGEEAEMKQIMKEARACVSQMFQPILSKLSSLDAFRPPGYGSLTLNAGDGKGQVDAPGVPEVDETWPFPFSDNPQDWEMEGWYYRYYFQNIN